jgi:hypothetical protein
LPCARRPAKAASHPSSNRTCPMLAIGVIAIFLAVILGLNKFEFGRFD